MNLGEGIISLKNLRIKRCQLLLIIVFAFLLFVTIALFAFQKVFASRVYPNVYLLDQEISGKNKGELLQLIDNKNNFLSEQNITIKVDDQPEATYKIQDTGAKINADKTADNCLNYGKSQNFFKNTLQIFQLVINKKEIKYSLEFDQEKIDIFLSQISAGLQKPSDARIELVGDEAKIIPEVSGREINLEDVKQMMVKRANNEQIEIMLLSIETAPELKTSDLSEALLQTNNILKKNIIFDYDSKKIRVDKPELFGWIKFEKNNLGILSANFSNELMKNFVARIAEQNDQKLINQTVEAVSNSIVQKGQVGKTMDQEKTLNDLIDELNKNNDNININISITKQNFQTSNAFAGKYIVVRKNTNPDARGISLLYRVENGSVIYDGIDYVFTANSTPTGTFNISQKSEKQWSNIYNVWMPYWQRFSGAYGIHGEVFPEGQDGPDGMAGGSGGCVAVAGYYDSKRIYDWTEIGTTVYIYSDSYGYKCESDYGICFGNIY